MEDGDVFGEFFLSTTLVDAFYELAEAQVLKTIFDHPLRYVTTLIQLGYEPLPPTLANWFYIGRPTLVLPNKFVYLKHIYNEDGISGCFMGLTSNISSAVVSIAAYYIVIQNNFETITAAATNNDFFSLVKWDCISTIVANILSHPFYVLTNRKMAQFIGKEVQYSRGMIIGLYEIARNEGIFTGWFSGLAPRLMADMSALFIYYSVVFIVYRHRVRIKYFPLLLYFGLSYMVFSVAYPLKTASVCISVNGSGLKAGSPPFIPDYNHDWLACYDDLSINNQFYRGGSYFWRQYIPPNK